MQKSILTILKTKLTLNRPKNSKKGQVSIMLITMGLLLIYMATTGSKINPSSKVEAKSVFTEADLKEIESRRNLKEGKLTGIAKGKNLIVLQVEALQNFLIDLDYNGQEVTPNLNKLIENQSSIYYDRYYQLPGRGGRSESEFVSHNSLHPSMEEASHIKYEKNTFYGLPLLLKDNGYTPWVMDGYEKDHWNRDKSYKSQGFERFISKEAYKNNGPIGSGLRDEDFFNQSLEYLKELDKIDEKPFYSFMVNQRSHKPKEYEELDLLPEHEGKLLGSYLQSIHYTDRQIGKFIENLKKEGLYDDTVIAIYGDGFPILSKDEEEKMMTELLGKNYNYDEIMNIPLIVHLPGQDIKTRISTTGSQIDFYPTMMNIMGYENEKGLILGRDLTNYKEYNYVAPQSPMSKGSLIDHDTVFIMAEDGIFDHSQAYNLKTQEKFDIPQMRPIYERAIEEINKSDFILKTNLLKDYMENDGQVDLDKLKAAKRLNSKYIAKADYESLEELSYYYNKGYKLLSLELKKDHNGGVIISNSNISLENLGEWIRGQEDVNIILTSQEDETLLIDSPLEDEDIREKLILEIKDFSSYPQLTEKGFTNIILNPIENQYRDSEILDFLSRHPHLGVILDRSRATTSLGEELKEKGIAGYIAGPMGRFSRTRLEGKLDGFVINPKEDKAIDLGDNKSSKYKNPHIVAHGGGQIASRTYTNSLEALNKSYGKGVRLMEIDFEWTTDEELVALHSWDGFVTSFFNQPVRKYSLEEFKNFKMINGWHQLTLEDVDRWFEQHDDAYLITDIKNGNLEALKKLKNEYPNLAKNTIPQIYQLSEYEEVKKLGYDNIILTLYMIRSSQDEIVNFVANNELFAVTMPIERAKTNLLKRIKDKGVYVYAHTVNSLAEADELEGLGVSGFYSDLFEE